MSFDFSSLRQKTVLLPILGDARKNLKLVDTRFSKNSKSYDNNSSSSVHDVVSSNELRVLTNKQHKGFEKYGAQGPKPRKTNNKKVLRLLEHRKVPEM